MSKYVIDSSTLVSIGDAVRQQEGTTEPIVVSEIPNRILGLPIGGGTGDIPEELFTVKGYAKYRFGFDGWNAFINTYGNKIKTSKLTDISYMFSECSTLENIPFDLEIDTSVSNFKCENLFNKCAKLKEFPKLIAADGVKRPVPTYSNFPSMSNFMYMCQFVREIPEDYFEAFVEPGFWEARKTYKHNGTGYMCSYMHSLRKVPPAIYKPFIHWGTSTSGTYSMYYHQFYNCFSLDEVVNLPVEYNATAFSSDRFKYTTQNCYRLKNFTFACDVSGVRAEAKWSNQTIELNGIGYCPDSSAVSSILQYNSGITADKEVRDAESYERLKNDEDWYGVGTAYSRYNAESARRTLNSLPYIPSSYTGNVISFTGEAGSATDGGAINTLPAEAIADATNNGWTVSFV